MTRVVWCSRHQPSEPHMREFRRLFGDDVEVIVSDAMRAKYPSAHDFIEAFKAVGGGDEMFVVAPLVVLAGLTRRGFQPLVHELRKPLPGDRETFVTSTDTTRGQWQRAQRFKRFVRVKKVEIEPL